MISIIISALIAACCGLAYSLIPDSSWGAYIAGLIGLGVSFFVINKRVQKRLNVVIEKVQSRLQELQEQVQKKMNHFQSRPGGNQAAFMKSVDKMQQQAVTEALAFLVEAEPEYKWNFLIEKQINTMRFQLNYQIKNFEEVDKYMDSVFLMDPTVIAMKMARLYKAKPLDREILKDESARVKALKEWDVAKAYRKGSARIKGSNAAMIFSTYAWMLLKYNLVEEALEVLTAGVKKTGDEVMSANLDRLRNGKAKSFSNAKYGEIWYALFLEEPQQPKQKVVRQRGGARNAGRPF
jgi:Skp family chaperone for outer membrane proteins